MSEFKLQPAVARPSGVVDARAMKIYNGSLRHRQRLTPSSRPAQLLAAFDRSRLSAAAFARRHGIGYSTLCAWRRRRANTKPSPAFVQVEVSEPIAPVELVIELGAQSRVRVTSDRQIELAREGVRTDHLSAE